jgi:hypothetical protein
VKPAPVAVPKRGWHPLLKVLIALPAIAIVGVLFVRSVRDARSEPYSVSTGHLWNWTLGVDPPDADGALVSLRPQQELAMNLFRQLFSRQMESMTTPNQPGISLALRGEIPSGVSADEVLALARQAGLESGTLTPKCVAYRRISAPGVTRELYFMWFDVPGFDRFRQAVASRAGSGFDPKELSPVMMIAPVPRQIPGGRPSGEAGQD